MAKSCGNFVNIKFIDDLLSINLNIRWINSETHSSCLLITTISLSCNNKSGEKNDMDKLLSAIADNDNAWNNLNVEKIIGMFSENGTLLSDNAEILR